MAYRTAPDNRTTMPTGIPHIIGNEAAERFSFYGMKAILAVFMARYLHLMGSEPGEAMSRAEAIENVHIFNTWVYLTPFLGALLADIFFGKYRIIIWLSLVYCAGHAALACMGVTGDARLWLFAGLALIALGSGGIKPCVSAHVGDQFGPGNKHLLNRVFNYFYFSINFGALISMYLTPWLLEKFGPHWAFGVPGVLMGIATLVFWIGRNRFIHVPAGGKNFLTELQSRDGLMALLKLAGLYLFVAIFWSLFDQTGSSWIFQAEEMNLNLFGRELLPSQIQSVNSLFVLTFIPLFTFVLYPDVQKIWDFTPLRKIGVGFALTASSFALSAIIQQWIGAGQEPTILWQILAYALLTAGEVMVSITALEFSYTQAPRKMKSLVMSLFLFSVSLGNFVTAGVNRFIQIPSPAADQQAHPGYVESAEPTLANGVAQIQALVHQNEGTLPTTETGQAALAGLRDPWDAPLRYSLLNSGKARISSDGPDQTTKTKWDLGSILTFPATEEELADDSWLARRKKELGLIEEPAPDQDPHELVATSFTGGQVKLEGPAYFWFFTWLMIGTTIIYVVMTQFYQPKEYLAEEGEEA